jgi:hypothetical protein
MTAFPVPSWSFLVPTKKGITAMISLNNSRFFLVSLPGPSRSPQAIDFAHFPVLSWLVSLSPIPPIGVSRRLLGAARRLSHPFEDRRDGRLTSRVPAYWSENSALIDED